MGELSGLKPELVFKYFEEMTEIPRGSGNMSHIQEYLINFAKKHKLEYYTDEAKNVLIKAPATKGYEESEPIILQGHMDMVCNKVRSCKKDMKKEGVDPYIDGDRIRAHGTTLGADDGIGLAIILAVLSSKDVEHPPIEGVFTTDEETDFNGVSTFDVKKLQARKMINLDTIGRNVVCSSCSGGINAVSKFDIFRKSYAGEGMEIVIEGLAGGHSGIDINYGRANAIKLAGRLLFEIVTTARAVLVSVDGGIADNAIPTSVEIQICTKDRKLVEEICKKYEGIFRHEYSVTDPNLEIRTKLVEPKFKPMSDMMGRIIITYIHTVINDVVRMSPNVIGLVQTSSNFGQITTRERTLTCLHGLRSSLYSELDMVKSSIKNLSVCLDGDTGYDSPYPGWEFSEESQIRDLVMDTYEELFGEKMENNVIHAGLECGYFSDKIPELDCIAIGFDLIEEHTPNESISISDVQRKWQLVVSVLKKLK